MLQFFMMRRVRKAAIADIEPFIDLSRHRLSGIPDATFIEPYMIGYMSALITLCARRALPSIATHELALVQGEAWARMTGLSADLFGEETCYLSAARHPDFIDGCRNALAFCTALHGSAVTDGFLADWAQPDVESGEDVFGVATDPQELWERFFESRIGPDIVVQWSDRL
jgi:hypothetical protein